MKQKAQANKFDESVKIKSIWMLFAAICISSTGCGLMNGFLTQKENSTTGFSVLALVQPPSSPSTVSQPTVKISGTTQGEIVTLFSDAQCTVAVSDAVLSSGGSVQVTLNALTVGSYTLHSMSKNSFGAVLKSCSIDGLPYVMTASPLNQITLLAGNIFGIGSLDGPGVSSRFNNPMGASLDSSGNVFVADSSNYTIRKISGSGITTTVAGRAGVSGSADGPAATATFSLPASTALDSAGNLYIADTYNCRIRKLSVAGIVSTVAGHNCGPAVDGTGSAAVFSFPRGIAITPTDNLVIADTYNNEIRLLTPAGVVTTIAGNGAPSNTNANGTSATFNTPQGVAVDAAGNIYVADIYNNAIRKIDIAGNVTTLAGSNSPFGAGSDDGAGSSAKFFYPTAIAVDGAGNLFVTDSENSTIRKITAGGVVSTIAGGVGTQGSADGTGLLARFNYPNGIAIDAGGTIFLTDEGGDTVRKITSGNIVSTLSGTAATRGATDGTGSLSLFSNPRGMVTDGVGNAYVVDSNNCTVRKITPLGVVTTVAGNPGVCGAADGNGTNATFNYPNGIALDESGNLYVADTSNHTIRKITPTGDVTTLAGIAGSSGSTDGAASNAKFDFPAGVAVDSTGVVYVADTNNSSIRKIEGGVVSTFAGLSATSGSTDGNLLSARFSYPQSLYLAGNGDIFVADTGNNTIRKISSIGVSTVAGQSGLRGHSDGAAGSATFNGPSYLSMSSSGDLYISDSYNYEIRKLSASGTVSTVLGTYQNSGTTLGSAPGVLNITSGIAISGSNLLVSTSNGIVQVATP